MSANTSSVSGAHRSPGAKKRLLILSSKRDCSSFHQDVMSAITMACMIDERLAIGSRPLSAARVGAQIMWKHEDCAFCTRALSTVCRDACSLEDSQ